MGDLIAYWWLTLNFSRHFICPFTLLPITWLPVTHVTSQVIESHWSDWKLIRMRDLTVNRVLGIGFPIQIPPTQLQVTHVTTRHSYFRSFLEVTRRDVKWPEPKDSIWNPKSILKPQVIRLFCSNHIIAHCCDMFDRNVYYHNWVFPSILQIHYFIYITDLYQMYGGLWYIYIYVYHVTCFYDNTSTQYY